MPAPRKSRCWRTRWNRKSFKLLHLDQRGSHTSLSSRREAPMSAGTAMVCFCRRSRISPNLTLSPSVGDLERFHLHTSIHRHRHVLLAIPNTGTQSKAGSSQRGSVRSIETRRLLERRTIYHPYDYLSVCRMHLYFLQYQSMEAHVYTLFEGWLPCSASSRFIWPFSSRSNCASSQRYGILPRISSAIGTNAGIVRCRLRLMRRPKYGMNFGLGIGL